MYLSLGVFSTTMTSSIQSNSQKVVKIFTGTIFYKGKYINVRFDCYTDKIEPKELYECIDINSTEVLPYSVVGENISNIQFVNSRKYKKD